MLAELKTTAPKYIFKKRLPSVAVCRACRTIYFFYSFLCYSTTQNEHERNIAFRRCKY